MRSVDPFEFISRHQDLIFRILGLLAAVLVVFLLIRAWAKRKGGWKAAYRLVRREIAVTAHAFAAPFRAWVRHRRSLRALVRSLRTPANWRDAERAVLAAESLLGGGRPYAVVVDEHTVMVLVTGRDTRVPDEGPWWCTEEDGPDRWYADRQDLPPVVPVPGQIPPVLVAIGEVEGRVAFLDVASGPPTVTVEGEQRSATAVHQAIAAQLDVRLPEGMVRVAEGVHRGYQGTPVRAAYRATGTIPAQQGVSPVLVAAGLPEPLPAEFAAPRVDPGGLRVLLRGPGRGYLRTLLTDRHGRVRVTGTPLEVSANALSRAIARVLHQLPPVLPPAPPAGVAWSADTARLFAEHDDEQLLGEAVDVDELALPAPTADSRLRGPVPETDAEPAFARNATENATAKASEETAPEEHRVAEQPGPQLYPDPRAQPGPRAVGPVAPEEDDDLPAPGAAGPRLAKSPPSQGASRPTRPPRS